MKIPDEHPDIKVMPGRTLIDNMSRAHLGRLVRKGFLGREHTVMEEIMWEGTVVLDRAGLLGCRFRDCSDKLLGALWPYANDREAVARLTPHIQRLTAADFCDIPFLIMGHEARRYQFNGNSNDLLREIKPLRVPTETACRMLTEYACLGTALGIGDPDYFRILGERTFEGNSQFEAGLEEAFGAFSDFARTYNLGLEDELATC